MSTRELHGVVIESLQAFAEPVLFTTLAFDLCEQIDPHDLLEALTELVRAGKVQNVGGFYSEMRT